jgi:putative tricarboxylic transport membrane protein
MSYELKLGKPESPGPGLMPFILGITLSICSLPILVHSFRVVRRKEKRGDEAIWSGVNFKRLILVQASLFGYIFILEKIGFMLATFLLLLILFKVIDSQKWHWALIASTLTIIITFFIFVVLLKIQLPLSLWRIG